MWLPNFLKSYKIYGFVLAILFYFPFIVHSLISNDVASTYNLYPFNIDVLGQMQTYLKMEAKPLYGLVNTLVPIFGLTPEFITFLGVLVFSYSILKSLELVAGNLTNQTKLILFVLAFCSPYLYHERDWFEQYLYTGIVNLLTFYSLSFLLKHKNIVDYLFAIVSILIGLNFFMPTFFWFAGFALILVLKQHLSNPFKTIKDFFIYAKPFLLVLLIAGLIYGLEYKILINTSIEDFRARQSYRTVDIPFIERLLTLPTIYPMYYNIIGLLIAFSLFFKKYLVGKFIFAVIVLYYMSSYVFYLAFGMKSSPILNYANYFTTMFMLSLFLSKHKNSLKVNKCFKIVALAFIIFFYGCSWFLYYKNYKYEYDLEHTLTNINQTIKKLSGKNDNPIIVLRGKHDLVIKKEPIISQLFTYKSGFYTCYAGNLNVNLMNMAWFNDWSTNLNVLAKRDELLKANKTYPNLESIFVYEGIYCVVY